MSEEDFGQEFIEVLPQLWLMRVSKIKYSNISSIVKIHGKINSSSKVLLSQWSSMKNNFPHPQNISGNFWRFIWLSQLWTGNYYWYLVDRG